MNQQLSMGLFLMSTCLLMYGCGNKNADTTQTTPSTQIEEVSDGSLIKITQSKDFPVIKAESRLVAEQLSVNGSIAPDISRTVAVNALSGGRIAEIHTRLGDEVKKGQLLLKIHSPDLANAIAALKQAKADELLAQRYYDRNKYLYDRGAVVAQKDVEAAEDALTDAKANTENAITQVKLLDADPNHPSAFVELRAPVSGVVVEQNIALGSAAKSLDATPNLFTIADLSRVWLLCDIYENNLSKVNVGDYAKIHINAYPNAALQGKVINIFSLLDPNTRSAKARIELDNSQGILRPGMFATAVFTAQTSLPVVTLPAAAVFRLHDKDWIFEPLGDNKYRRIEVKTGGSNADGTLQILAGLQVGDSVIANSLQLSAAAQLENPVALEDKDNGESK
jgi:cobalt-zinc-cadmium efflux system membrane fusion protein